MSNEKKGNSSQTEAFVPPFTYPFPQGNFQPIFLHPVPYEVATSINGEDQQSLLQSEDEGEKCIFKRFCKRWRKGKCCKNKAVVDDGRALGNLYNFIVGVLFGTFAPFFSLVCVYGFESKKLTRTGALFGSANFFILLAACLIAFGAAPHGPRHGHGLGMYHFAPLSFNNHTNTDPVRNSTDLIEPSLPLLGRPGEEGPVGHKEDNDNDDENDDDKNEKDISKKHVNGEEKEHEEEKNRKHKTGKDKNGKHKKGNHSKFGEENHRKSGKGHRRFKKCRMFKFAVGGSFIVGLLFLVAAIKSFRGFMSIYRVRENKPECDNVRAVSDAGSCRGFFFGMIASLLWPLIATALVIVIRRKDLSSRYGAIHGLGVFFIIIGSIMAFHGVPPIALFKGLLLCQISAVHFKRAIASANSLEGKISHC